MNGYDGMARDSFNELTEALTKCKESLSADYESLSNGEKAITGESILDKINSIESALDGLKVIGYRMEDAGIA